MGTIDIVFESRYRGFYRLFGSQFVRFTTQPQLQNWKLEQAIKANTICRELIEFYYDTDSGKGYFILPGSSVSPAGYRALRYPLPRIVTQRTVYRWQDRVRDETHTHIGTGAHGFESLCCSEMLAEMVEEAELATSGKVTCPLCKIIWEDCRAFEPCDFIDT
ncbi:TPA: hypothetical protein LC301_003909 [Salmonella enterica subsp. enterica serovar Veneziana]|nr:hypothetical protein [Salmonella enterica subsp. enterica serovar Veneziana]